MHVVPVPVVEREQLGYYFIGAPTQQGAPELLLVVKRRHFHAGPLGALDQRLAVVRLKLAPSLVDVLADVKMAHRGDLKLGRAVARRQGSLPVVVNDLAAVLLAPDNAGYDDWQPAVSGKVGRGRARRHSPPHRRRALPWERAYRGVLERGAEAPLPGHRAALPYL
jgi:hypothetical protein